MSKKNGKALPPLSTRGLQKVLTGITGLDEITGGGLPASRPALICGGPGCGKTLMSMEFLVKGAIQFNEPAIFQMSNAYW